MSLLKQINDKGAVLEWSPVAKHASLVALGTKDSSGIGFDDYGGELEIHSLDFSSTSSSSSTLLGKVRANSRFSSLAWSEMTTNSSQYPYGLIAGGMMDGNIHVWDPSKIVSDQEQCLIASVEQHQGAVGGLAFNRHKESSHLLASGGSDGEVFVMSLERPECPNTFIPAPPPNNAKHTSGITKVAWNTQVAYILASAAQNGSCFVWDLRQKKAWAELRDPSGGCVADVSWNPDQGLNIITASGDDKNPVIKLWDLRSSTSLPLATLQGHTEGILSTSWCPSDASLLLSCGKDNRTILWDLFNLQAVYELPTGGDNKFNDNTSNNFSASDQASVFGGLASSVGQRRHHICWSPCLPAVISACSFDRRVQFYSLSGVKSKLGRAPKWLRRPVGASFGFGGKLVRFNNTTSPLDSSSPSTCTVTQVVEDTEFITNCDTFHAAVESGNYGEFCEFKSKNFAYESDSNDQNAHEQQKVWSLMKVICFEKNAREELLSHLGFHTQDIAKKAQEFVSRNKKMITTPTDSNAFFSGEGNNSDVNNEEVPPPVIYSTVSAKTTAEAEATVRQAIVVGNFTSAVDCCVEVGMWAEALILAQCGDQALWTKTQEAFFESQRYKKPFLNTLHSVIRGELLALVEQSDLSCWKETLAVLSTYGKSEEFPLMCETLAKRLEADVRFADGKMAATMCYMCAANVEQTVDFWLNELSAANKKIAEWVSADATCADKRALQSFVEKVQVFSHANPGTELGARCGDYFTEYAHLLAAHGRFDYAQRYIKAGSAKDVVLLDRLYHAGSRPAGSRPPLFPFERVTVNEVEAAKPVPQTGKKRADSYSKSQPIQSVQPVQPVQPAQPTPSPVASPALPPEWSSITDPSSGRAYYYNSVTQQTQWEPPVVTPAPTPAATMNSQPHKHTPQFSAQSSEPPSAVPKASTAPPSAVPRKLVIDTAQSQPAALVKTLATQPGQPFQPPAIQPTGQTTPSIQPVTEAAPPTAGPAGTLPEAVQLLVDLALATAAACTPAEKRQMAMATEAVNCLSVKATQQEVAPDIMAKVEALAREMTGKNFTAAQLIQTDLANTAWGLHKDWIKGLKVFIQIASKK